MKNEYRQERFGDRGDGDCDLGGVLVLKEKGKKAAGMTAKAGMKMCDPENG